MDEIRIRYENQAVLSLLKWLGTALQLGGAIIVALHLSWSGWAFPVMLAGSLLWTALAATAREWSLAAMNAGFALINILGIARWLA